MAFYIKPPRGVLSLADVETLAWQRFRFLLVVESSGGSVMALKDLIEESSMAAQSEGLIEGTQKDLVSHFIVRLACAQDEEMEKFLLQTESRLFNYRFSCMTHSELHTSIQPLRRFVRSCKSLGKLSPLLAEVLSILKNLTESWDWPTLLLHFVNGENFKFVELPFQHVPGLVGKRLVTLDGGIAHVPCSKLYSVMGLVFRLLLKHGMDLSKQMVESVLETDYRMEKLFRNMKLFFHKHDHRRHSPHTAMVKCEDIEDLVEYFPPCMSYLHRQLRDSHRLRHQSRIQYTLYLKEIGLPVNEALQFWRSEYSRPPSHGASHNHGCSHNWDKDGQRYTYNIRHLYGLEGARINYRGHCCRSLQEMSLGHGEQGGCPFKHFDQQHLLQELSLADLPLDSIRTILKLTNQEERHTEACLTYMLAKADTKIVSSELDKNSAYVNMVKIRKNNGRCKNSRHLITMESLFSKPSDSLKSPFSAKKSSTDLVDCGVSLLGHTDKVSFRSSSDQMINVKVENNETRSLFRHKDMGSGETKIFTDLVDACECGSDISKSFKYNSCSKGKVHSTHKCYRRSDESRDGNNMGTIRQNYSGCAANTTRSVPNHHNSNGNGCRSKQDIFGTIHNRQSIKENAGNTNSQSCNHGNSQSGSHGNSESCNHGNRQGCSHGNSQSCYNHDVCPPSQCIETGQLQSQSVEHCPPQLSVKTHHSLGNMFNKPIDFYVSYKQLVNGLKC